METIVRLHPTYDTRNVWGGTITSVPIEGDPDCIAAKLEDVACLWYFQFKQNNTEKIYQYFGVLDFDFNRTLATYNCYPDRKALLEDEDIKRIITLLNEKFDKFTVYFSGSKGIHVYVYDASFFVYPPTEYADNGKRLTWLDCYLKTVYGDELYSLLDKSIYPLGKGIRPYSMVHPKTIIRPFTIYQKGEEDNIWNFIIGNQIWKEAKVFIPEINNLMPEKSEKHKLVTSNVKAITLDESSSDMSKQVVDYFNTKPGLVGNTCSIIKVASKESKNLYKILDSYYCPNKGGTHKQGAKVYFYLYSCHAYFKCFSGKCQGKEYTLKKLFPPLTCLSDLSEELYTNNVISQKPLEIYSVPGDQKYIGIEDIQWSLGMDDLAKYGYIAAPMGCGKTTSLRTYIENQPDSFTCLLVVVRQTQAHTFAPIYPDMTNYLNCKAGSLYGKKRLVVCVNSLTRVLSPTGLLPSYDLLILDEIESIIEGLISSMLSNGRSLQMEIWDTMIALIKCSKSTLFMDGIPTERSLKYLDKIGILPFVRVVEMKRSVDYRTYIIYSHAQILMETIEANIRTGKKVVMVSNCKTILQHMFDEITVPSGNKLIITGDSEKEVKLTAADPDKHWVKDLLAFNSAVGPGTSFNPTIYQEMVVIIACNSSSPQVLFQMINRIRVLEDCIVRMIILDGNNNTIPTRKEIKEKKMTNIITMQHKQTTFPKTNFFKVMDKEYTRLTIRDLDHRIAKELVANQLMVLKHEDDLFLDMLVDYEYEKRVLENSDEYSKQLFLLIRRNGGIVREEINPNPKTIQTSTRMLKMDARKHDIQRSLELTNNVIWTVPPNIAPGAFTKSVIEGINIKVPRNEIDAHYMWLAFRRAVTETSDQTLYEKEFFQIVAKRRAVNNTLLFSNGMLDDIRKLCQLCQIDIKPVTGLVRGSVKTSMKFFEDRGQVDALCARILESIRSKTQFNYQLNQSTKDTVTKVNKATLSNIKLVFSCFGIFSEIVTTKIRPLTGRKGPGIPKTERYVESFLNFSEEAQQFRMAISKIDPKTGEYDMDAFEKYFNEILSGQI